MTWTSEAAKREERQLKKIAEQLRKNVIANRGPQSVQSDMWGAVSLAIARVTLKYAERGIRDE